MLLDTRSQAEVMAMIPQFARAEADNFAPVPQAMPEQLGVLMFNMERGVHLEEIREFLRDCPAIQPFDLILANELDDGCFRSGNKKIPPGSWQRPSALTTPGAWSSLNWWMSGTKRASTATPCFPGGQFGGQA